MALLLQAQRTLRTKLAAQALDKNPLAVNTGRILRVLRSLVGDMRFKPRMVLTDRQREMCMKILGLTELPPVKGVETPEVLKDLPKKPPHRRHEK